MGVTLVCVGVRVVSAVTCGIMCVCVFVCLFVSVYRRRQIAK